MDRQALFSRLLTLPVHEKRSVAENFFEAVFLNTGLGPVNGLLEEFLGAPLKPAGEKVSSEARDATQEYGGIQKNQTLYKKESVIAILWPWGDNTYTTLKIIATN